MRRYAEIALRTLGFVAIAALLFRVWPRAAQMDNATVQVRFSNASMSDTSGLSAVRELLPLVTSSRAIGAVDAERASSAASLSSASLLRMHFPLATIPPRSARYAISALANSFATVSWTDSTNAKGLAISATSSADPKSRVLVSVTGAPGSMLVSDNGGVLDSINFGPGPSASNGSLSAASTAALLLLRTGSPLTSQQNGSFASITSPQIPVVRRLLVYARPGWESKFVIAALEEAGWSVDGSLPIAPRVVVKVGDPRSLDTNRYAAAIIVDSGVVTAATLVKFVRQGGGVVISGDALKDRALAAIASVRVTGVRNAVPGGLLTPQPTSGLEMLRVAVAADAIVLQRDPGSLPAITVRRVAGGRVAGAMFPESWRRRMEGNADGADDHREYWTGLVRAVAHMSFPSSRDTSPASLDFDAAPYASLVAALGLPAAMPSTLTTGISTSSQAADSRFNAILLAVALTALLAEWLLRRLRGAR